MQPLHNTISQHLSNAQTHNCNDHMDKCRTELCAAVQRIDDSIQDTQSLTEPVEPHDPTGKGLPTSIPQGREPTDKTIRGPETRLDDMTIAELQTFAAQSEPPIMIPEDKTRKADIREVIDAELALRNTPTG